MYMEKNKQIVFPWQMSLLPLDFFIHMDMALFVGVFRLYRDVVATANHEATYRCLVSSH